MKRSLSVAFALLALSAAPALAQTPAPQPTGCRMGLVAELPVTFERNQPTVPVQIDGHPLKALLDTGSFKSLIFRNAADRLKLKLREVGEIAGVDGRTKAYGAQVNALTLMGQSSPPLEMMVGSASPKGIDMLIGRDILGRTDIELDLGHGKVRLLRPNQCADDQMAYWSDRYSEARLIEGEGDDFRLGVKLNGVYITAIIDSGAQRSIADQGVAFRADVSLADPVSTDVSSGIAGRKVETRRGVVKLVTIGDEQLRNVQLSFGPMYTQNLTHGRLQVISPVEMLLGADFLKAHRVLIAHETGKAYFTYNGGPIFRTDPQPLDSKNAPGATKTASPPAAPEKPAS